jgi:GNAT superfamily N-acetyltransferase
MDIDLVQGKIGVVEWTPFFACPAHRSLMPKGYRRWFERLQRCEAGYADRVPLHVLVSDPDSGEVVGGITGRTSLGLMFIDLVYLPENLRGRDIGARMMALAEEEARRRGCRAGVLYTISFQAPGF